MVVVVKSLEECVRCFNHKCRNELPSVQKQSYWVKLEGIAQKKRNQVVSVDIALYLSLITSYFSVVSCLSTGLANPDINSYELCADERPHLFPVLCLAGSVDDKDKGTK